MDKPQKSSIPELLTSLYSCGKGFFPHNFEDLVGAPKVPLRWDRITTETCEAASVWLLTQWGLQMSISSRGIPGFLFFLRFYPLTLGKDG